MNTSDVVQEKRNRFIARYNAFWGDWPGHESRKIEDQWNRLLDNVELEKHEQLFSKVLVMHGRRKGGPKASLFWLVWKEIRPPKPQKEKPTSDHCGLCNGTGMMWGKARWEKDGEGDTVWHFPDRPDFPGPISNVAAACICPRGDRLRHQSTEGQQAQILSWRRDVLPNLIPELGISSLGSSELWAAHALSMRANRAAFNSGKTKETVETPETASLASDVVRDGSVAERPQAPSNGGDGVGMGPVPEPATGPLQANEETPF